MGRIREETEGGDGLQPVRCGDEILSEIGRSSSRGAFRACTAIQGPSFTIRSKSKKLNRYLSLKPKGLVGYIPHSCMTFSLRTVLMDDFVWNMASMEGLE